MFDKIRSMLTGETEPKVDDAVSLKDAVATLLVETATMDGTFDERERKAITKLLSNRFTLSNDEATALIAAGEEAAHHGNELYGITRTIKQSFSHQERINMMEMVWEVIYADEVLDDYEANLARRVAGLIYISDQESGEARKRVLDRLQLSRA